MSCSQAAAGGSGGWRPPFTASQWQELEHQTLIFKYLVAGVPVPPELLLPIFKSFESMTARFYHHADMGYFLCGKKPDLEPWRCRRTDGKKWRCSKNAYPDSKYCERHMNRGRNRSRKPVELRSLSQLQPPTSSPSLTVTTLAPPRSGICGTGSSSTRNFPSSAPLNSLGTGIGNYATQMSLSGAILGQLHIGSGYCQRGSEDNSYLPEAKFTMDEHNFLSEAPGSAGAHSIDSSVDGGWQLIPPQISAYSVSKPIDDSHIQSSPLLQPTQYFDLESSSSLPRQQQKQRCFFRDEFDSKALMKQEGQLLLSSFDEWPNARNSWPDLEDDKSNKTSISTTQLSISTSMTSSEFSTPCSRSPDGDE